MAGTPATLIYSAEEQWAADLLQKGTTADFANHPSGKIVRAEFVRYLLLQYVTKPSIAPVGVAIRNATIVGNLSCLNFGSLAAPLPVLDLAFSDIEGRLDLSGSFFSSVVLEGCSMRGLTAPWLNVGNGLWANDLSLKSDTPVLVDLEGLTSTGDVKLRRLGRGKVGTAGHVACRLRLSKARIGGSLDLSASTLEMPASVLDKKESSIPSSERAALLLQSAEIGGSVSLDVVDGVRFEAKGGANFDGSRIGDQLSMLGARFEGATRRTGNETGNDTALTLDRIRTANSVFLSEVDTESDAVAPSHRFKAIGEVRLVGACIGGQLACIGASFQNSGGDALSLDRAEISGSLFLHSSWTNRLLVEGVTRLVGIKVGGQLSCSGAKFHNPKGVAMHLAGAEIAGPAGLVSFDDERLPGGKVLCLVDGIIRMAGAKIGGSLRCEARIKFPEFAKPSSTVALDFENVSVGHTLLVRLDEGSSGEVVFRGARVGSLDDNIGEGWGLPPRNAPAGKLVGIQLRLDGFVYDRLGSRISGRQDSGASPPDDDEISARRIKWLRRQYCADKPVPNDFFPQPHEQLAKVLRVMGHDDAARYIACHKSEHEAVCGVSKGPMRGVMWIYRTCFGAGYLPLRALATVFVFWLLGTALTCVALMLNSPDRVILARSVPPVELVRWLGIPDMAPISPNVRDRDKKVGDRVLYAPHGEVQSRDIPCTEIRPPLYALDVMVPFVGLHVADKCEMSDRAPGWIYGKAIYEIVGWLIVALAALTWSGVLRKDAS